MPSKSTDPNTSLVIKNCAVETLVFIAIKTNVSTAQFLITREVFGSVDLLGITQRKPGMITI